MSSFSSVEMLQGYLKVLTDRQQMITSNMANIDTPGYHTKDLNFQAAVRRVMDEGDPGSNAALEPVSLETHAQFRIRGAILDSLRVLDWSPRELRRKGRAVQEAIQTMTRNLRRTPTETEIARELNLGIHEYQLLLGQLKGLEIGSLNLEHNDDSGEDQLAYIAGSPEDDPLFLCLQGEMRQLLVDAIEELPEKERMVLTLYYYEELTMREIGLTLGVVESRVSQIHSSAVVRLRASLHGIPKIQKPTAVRRMRNTPTDC
ncbi:sigma-70 family RNA polymerase sigma factor [Granulicella sp. L46]|uniref:sigma-70 family RNA polymerase sigma factor n=1 Tax=Granulicella sp. L46 TaxID=1641865 RepID=UPI0020B10BB9|nr:sigma-70 family RNA polymerase sigma factor [Granulicella sp. L46]